MKEATGNLVKRHPHALLLSVAIVVGIAMARTMYVPGVIGYVDDWNVPSSPRGLWIWGISDLSGWSPIEFGMPLAYPTDLYLKLALGIFGLFGTPTHLVVALFLTFCFTFGYVGVARAVEYLWGASLARQLAAGLLFVTSPALFDALVPGYLTFILSYVLMPWLVIALVRALRDERGAWYLYAFTVALSLAQVQFVIFDAMLTLTVLVGLRATLHTSLRAVTFLVAGSVLPYLFILAGVISDSAVVGTTLKLSVHSWTSLSAPGIFNAVMLVPSVYPLFDQSLHGWDILWRLLAIAWVVLALACGFRSSQRIARAFGWLLVVSFVLLYGKSVPFGTITTWLLNLPMMALLRNVNYVFALVSFALSILIVCPLRDARRDGRQRSVMFLTFAAIWSVPFIGNFYAAWISPIPGSNTTHSIVGETGRMLVLPHLQVIDDRRPSRGGVNPNSVETITPIFVRNTPTGALEASILDRLTDWGPEAQTFAAALNTARVNTVALQPNLDSTFPQFVNSYRDQWLTQAYRTVNIQQRLDNTDGLNESEDNGTKFYGTSGGYSDVQTARYAVALSGSIEDEIAMRAIGVNGLFVSAEQVPGASASWTHGFVEGVGAPPFLASPLDIEEGAYRPAGLATSGSTADFHEDWVDPMASANFWLTSRILSVSHAAITDKRGAALLIPVPQGRRDVWLQYSKSRFGGSIEVSGPVASRTINTFSRSLGDFRWIELGETKPGRHAALRLRSVNGFNALGNVAMLTDKEELFDRGRLAGFTKFGRAEVASNITFDSDMLLPVWDAQWHPSVLLANLSAPVRFSIQVEIERSDHRCSILIGRAILRDFTVALDGHAPIGNAGAFFRIASFSCGANSTVSLDGIALSSRPKTIDGSPLAVQLKVESLTARGDQDVDSTITIPFLPLAFPPLSNGRHILTISYPALFPGPGEQWTALEDAQEGSPPGFNVGSGIVKQTRDGAWIRMSTTQPAVDVHAKLRSALPSDQMMITGSCTASKGSLVRIAIYNGKTDSATFDIPGDGHSSDFHVDLAKVHRTKSDVLYVYLFPQGTGHAYANIRINPAVQEVSANLILMEPSFRVSSEKELKPTNAHFLRYHVIGPRQIVQYDQTFDRGWGISGKSVHYASTSGFNLWVLRERKTRATIYYRSGVAYAVGVVVSCVIMLILAAASIRSSWFNWRE